MDNAQLLPLIQVTASIHTQGSLLNFLFNPYANGAGATWNND
jgi:hypothetical protein